jgi:hypothetical protein
MQKALPGEAQGNRGPEPNGQAVEEKANIHGMNLNSCSYIQTQIYPLVLRVGDEEKAFFAKRE